MEKRNLFGLDMKYQDIPLIFQSYINEEPFQNCIACGKYLLDKGTHYFMEKVIRKNSVEIEYAMCFDCIQKSKSIMSEESERKSTEYFEKHVNIFDRSRKMFENEDAGYEKWISNCLLKGTPVHETEEYILYAHCEGKQMVLSLFPYMISGEVMEEVQGLLSAKTKEELDRFTDEHFGLPPEWKEIFKRDMIFI